MTTEKGFRVAELESLLHPTDTQPESLPVRGYHPGRDDWRPRPAAVLVPLVLQPEPAVILTVRSRQLLHHAGQVALPGGRRQCNERFPLETALRETREEIGVDSAQLRIHGLLDRFDTITGFRIVPVVASVLGQPQLTACPDEVEKIFAVPWSVVSDPSNYRRHRVERGRHRFEVTSIAHSSWMIWGATAAILEELCRRAGSHWLPGEREPRG